MQDCHRNQPNRYGEVQHIPVDMPCGSIDRTHGRQKPVCNENHQIPEGMVLQERIQHGTCESPETYVQQRHPRPQPQSCPRNTGHCKKQQRQPVDFPGSEHSGSDCLGPESIFTVHFPPVIEIIAPCIPGGMENHYVQQCPHAVEPIRLQVVC